jgi:uncharacterized membrane protein YphA (DoxX/SURF4 family)
MQTSHCEKYNIKLAENTAVFVLWRASMQQKTEYQEFGTLFDRMDREITRWMARYGLVILRFGLGVIFVWFGALKLVPGLSPAEELVRNTVYFVKPDLFQPILAIWEILIGIGFLTGRFLRVTILLLFGQMAGTVLPLFLLPEVVWTVFPYGLTLEGQYIIKNLIIIGSALVLGGTARGGRIEPEPGKDEIR